jgi:DNA processing protein
VSSNETVALVALLRGARTRRPAHVYAALVEERGSALAVLEEEWGAKQRAPGLLDQETMQTLLATAEADLGQWQRQGIRPLTVLDGDYPDNLRAVHDRPPLIFVAGALYPADARAVAVIGTRRASKQGIAAAEQIVGQLIGDEYTVVSGLAAGIDTAAHEAALAAGGRTLAVIGTGLSRCYPPENAPLQRRIAHDHAVISQFWPDTPPSRHTFPMRNATTSGLALATVVVEAGERSGALACARRALNHGRPVFLAEPLLALPSAQHLASRPGVHVTREPDDITARLERLTSTDALLA